MWENDWNGDQMNGRTLDEVVQSLTLRSCLLEGYIATPAEHRLKVDRRTRVFFSFRIVLHPTVRLHTSGMPRAGGRTIVVWPHHFETGRLIAFRSNGMVS